MFKVGDRVEVAGYSDVLVITADFGFGCWECRRDIDGGVMIFSEEDLSIHSRKTRKRIKLPLWRRCHDIKR